MGKKARIGDGTESLQGVARLDEDWRIVETVLPVGWMEQAYTQGAIQRTRGIKDARQLLRLMLIHLADGCGLRETAARARLTGLANMSDVAILKRLRGCGAWFEWMSQQLRRAASGPDAAALLPGRRIRAVDGTMVSEPGDTGSQWRLHYSLQLPGLQCDEVTLTTPALGETLKRYQIAPGDVLIADRGYAHPAGIAHVIDHQGDVLIRCNLVTLPFTDRNGQALDILAHLRTLSVGEAGDWPVAVRFGKRLIPGRLCAIKKSAAATAKAEQRVRRESQRGQSVIRPETIEAAAYVFVFSTLTRDTLGADGVLELYRMRWQIELHFKRLKSVIGLGHLKKHDEIAAKAWLQGKLMVACLIDRLIHWSDAISPWGFAFERAAAPEDQGCATAPAQPLQLA